VNIHEKQLLELLPAWWRNAFNRAIHYALHGPKWVPMHIRKLPLGLFVKYVELSYLALRLARGQVDRLHHEVTGSGPVGQCHQVVTESATAPRPLQRGGVLVEPTRARSLPDKAAASRPEKQVFGGVL
jgi:hypothetical protein